MGHFSPNSLIPNLPPPVSLTPYTEEPAMGRSGSVGAAPCRTQHCTSPVPAAPRAAAASRAPGSGPTAGRTQGPGHVMGVGCCPLVSGVKPQQTA